MQAPAHGPQPGAGCWWSRKANFQHPQTAQGCRTIEGAVSFRHRTRKTSSLCWWGNASRSELKLQTQRDEARGADVVQLQLCQSSSSSFSVSGVSQQIQVSASSPSVLSLRPSAVTELDLPGSSLCTGDFGQIPSSCRNGPTWLVLRHQGL